MNERIIGKYEGEASGPLLICIGGIHGNEPAGILAIEEVLRLLGMEPESNPGFIYSGSFVGIKGNLGAITCNSRFVHRDLNRMLTKSEIKRIENTNTALRTAEDRECIELIATIEAEIDRHDHPFTLILDFHTTTAAGGIFTIAADDPDSRSLALGLHAPVILGIAEGLSGTTIEYFNHPASGCHCIVFEAGQHDDPGCVDRSVSAIVNSMRSIGAVRPSDVHHRHDDLLMNLSKGFPRITKLLYHYKIDPAENFKMQLGYKNFQPVQAGEIVACNDRGGIQSPYSGLILMPKYQSLGDDGFFIVSPIE